MESKQIRKQQLEEEKQEIELQHQKQEQQLLKHDKNVEAAQKQAEDMLASISQSTDPDAILDES